MNISKSQKTMRVLYLYLTIPLLLVTMVLTAVALMSVTSKKKAPTTEMPLDSHGSAASAGSAAPDEPPSLRMRRPSVEIPQPPPQVKEESSSNTAGQAAIIAAITTGITGLLGAIMQTIVAFLKAKEKRRSDSAES